MERTTYSLFRSHWTSYRSLKVIHFLSSGILHISFPLHVNHTLTHIQIPLYSPKCILLHEDLSDFRLTISSSKRSFLNLLTPMLHKCRLRHPSYTFQQSQLCFPYLPLKIKCVLSTYYILGLVLNILQESMKQSCYCLNFPSEETEEQNG